MAHSMPPTPAEIRLHASAMSNVRWGRASNRTAETAPARDAFMARFEREADPDGVLSPEERARRATNLRTAYFQRLALKSARARRAKREASE